MRRYKKSYSEADKPLVGMSGVPQVKVSIIVRVMQLVGNHTHFRAIQEQ